MSVCVTMCVSVCCTVLSVQLKVLSAPPALPVQCGPCRSFTPQLCKTYNKVNEQEKRFEIIFCSSDRTEQDFQEYFGTMPWLAMPFNDDRKKALSRHFDVSGIPTLVLVEGDAKTVITKNGRGPVMEDPEGKVSL